MFRRETMHFEAKINEINSSFASLSAGNASEDYVRFLIVFLEREVQISFAKALTCYFDSLRDSFSANINKQYLFDSECSFIVTESRRMIAEDEEKKRVLLSLEKIEEEKEIKKMPSLLRIIANNLNSSFASEKSNFMKSNSSEMRENLKFNSQENSPLQSISAIGNETDNSQYIYLAGMEKSETDFNLSQSSVQKVDKEGNVYCCLQKVGKENRETTLTRYF